MGDWIDDLPPEERDSFDKWVDHVRRDALEKITESNAIISLVPKKTDIKFAVELGLAIMMDKPILAVAMPGVEIPDKLRLVADQVVEVDIDTEEGRAALTEALSKIVGASGE